MTPRFDFASDTAAAAAPEALDALIAANRGFMSGYGSDPISAQAADLVRALLDADAEVRFVPSGTAANALSLAALCRPFEAVLAHEHAHVCMDETGAPGFYGHGLGMVGLRGASGRIAPEALAAALAGGDSAHQQSPAALSLTNATEFGAVYSAAEIGALTAAVKAKGYGVHLDGARLANAAAAGFDLTGIRRLGVDILVIGGSKAGMTPTEAIVIFDRSLARRFDARLKQVGQLPSKSRFLAAPFVGMLQDGTLLRHAAHANTMARRLADQIPFPLRHPVESNGVFVEMDDATLTRLHGLGWTVYRFIDGSVRFMCSWMTTADSVDAVSETMRSLR